MQLTHDQERAVMDGACRHDDAIRHAMGDAHHALHAACARCWYRNAPQGWCRGRDCPVCRICAEIEKCRRMMDRGKLSPSWYVEAKAARTLAEVPFLAEGGAE